MTNSICAWALRHLPVFGVFGSGDYKLQPIYVDDLAAAAVEKVSGTENEVVPVLNDLLVAEDFELSTGRI
jgi:nucleoside-diphosphate-sugar epimerase